MAKNKLGIEVLSGADYDFLGIDDSNKEPEAYDLYANLNYSFVNGNFVGENKLFLVDCDKKPTDDNLIKIGNLEKVLEASYKPIELTGDLINEFERADDKMCAEVNVYLIKTNGIGYDNYLFSQDDILDGSFDFKGQDPIYAGKIDALPIDFFTVGFKQKKMRKHKEPRIRMYKGMIKNK